MVSAVQERTALIRLHGELDLDAVAPVVEKFADLAERGLSSVVVDASGLTFLDSSGLRALLTGREKLNGAGTRLHVVDASPSVARVLEMTGTRAMLEG
jgi:anti-anti-sigma factor